MGKEEGRVEYEEERRDEQEGRGIMGLRDDRGRSGRGLKEERVRKKGKERGREQRHREE